MTHQEFDKRLDEILQNFGLQIYEQRLYDPSAEWDAAKIKAKQAIDRLFLDVVGEDEPTPQSIFDYGDDDQRKYWFNKLRQQLRTTITGKEG